MFDIKEYYNNCSENIKNSIANFECQPILFVGSGLSQRYFNAPTWGELLREMFEFLPGGKELYKYNFQKYGRDFVAIGDVLVDLYFDWAWGAGRDEFPEQLFDSNFSKDYFLKYSICKLLEEKLRKFGVVNRKEEIEIFKNIKPHAIITTNYDFLLENIFEGYETITGQRILRYNTNSYGEIYHIHGDVSNPESIVLTSKDYDDWKSKKKYISAKLLTYFAEHPVFIFGYGMGDENIKSILKDIGEIVSNSDGIIENVYQVVWLSEKIERRPSDQFVFNVDGKEYRIQAIYTNELNWVFEALQSQSELKSVNAKLVRALASRTMRLIRHDIPAGIVRVDYDILERVAQNGDELPKLLGITTVENTNQLHPYTLTQVAQRLGYSHWSPVNKILDKIKKVYGVDLRGSDNRYHCRIKTGSSKDSHVRKWSEQAVDLFQKIKDGKLPNENFINTL